MSLCIMPGGSQGVGEKVWLTEEATAEEGAAAEKGATTDRGVYSTIFLGFCRSHNFTDFDNADPIFFYLFDNANLFSENLY